MPAGVAAEPDKSSGPGNHPTVSSERSVVQLDGFHGDTVADRTALILFLEPSPFTDERECLFPTIGKFHERINLRLFMQIVMRNDGKLAHP